MSGLSLLTRFGLTRDAGIVPPSGVSLVGAASALASTVSLPAHVAGDRIYGWFVGLGGSLPTLPSGWADIYLFNGTGRRGRLAYTTAVAAGTADPSSANADICQVALYRGVASHAVKESDAGANSYPNFTFSAQSLTSSASRLVLFAWQASTGYAGMATLFSGTAVTQRAHDAMSSGATYAATLGDTAPAASFAGLSKSVAGGSYAKVALELNP